MGMEQFFDFTCLVEIPMPITIYNRFFFQFRKKSCKIIEFQYFWTIEAEKKILSNGN